MGEYLRGARALKALAVFCDLFFGHFWAAAERDF